MHGIQNIQNGSKLRRKHRAYQDTFPTCHRKCVLWQANSSSCTWDCDVFHRHPCSAYVGEAQQPQPGQLLSPFYPLPSLFHFLPSYSLSWGGVCDSPALSGRWDGAAWPSEVPHKQHCYLVFLSEETKLKLNCISLNLYLAFQAVAFISDMKKAYVPEVCLIFPTTPAGIRSELATNLVPRMLYVHNHRGRKPKAWGSQVTRAVASCINKA